VVKSIPARAELAASWQLAGNVACQLPKREYFLATFAALNVYWQAVSSVDAKDFCCQGRQSRQGRQIRQICQI
jgi:hypothetical protein